ncbi:hypothetical protein [Noviherbaspirillum sp. Root189]|uniref:hypothetical protein n=1 Tax=Noviherbaspirillum sp. Root189 TaxID=1736487 RepID=UPI0007102EE9|nr:hypothetical protein [Noviherbaspirillum sp. Root189]KRB77627.1 hypothetical protein ASE07_26125 [Noviherbaspirillum sp. Root189]
MSGLVHPWIHKIPAHWYLERIVALSDLKIDLSSLIADPEPSDNDKDIRDFLEDISIEVEKNYAVARSGRIVTNSGIWICTTLPTEHVRLASGQTLPQIGNTEVVWMCQRKTKGSAEEILQDEFNAYYLRRTLKGSVNYSEPDEYAEYSAQRLRGQTNQSSIRSMLALLAEMINDREHWITKQIESSTELDWTKNEKNWAWFQTLLSKIRLNLSSSENQ